MRRPPPGAGAGLSSLPEPPKKFHQLPSEFEDADVDADDEFDGGLKGLELVGLGLVLYLSACSLRMSAKDISASFFASPHLRV